MKNTRNPDADPSTAGAGWLADRTLDRWIGIDAPPAIDLRLAPSADGTADEWDGQRRRFTSPWKRARRAMLRLARYVLGLPEAPAAEPALPLSEYLFDIVGWCVIAAVCATLVYLIYHGLQVLDYIR